MSNNEHGNSSSLVTSGLHAIGHRSWAPGGATPLPSAALGGAIEVKPSTQVVHMAAVVAARVGV